MFTREQLIRERCKKKKSVDSASVFHVNTRGCVVVCRGKNTHLELEQGNKDGRACAHGSHARASLRRGRCNAGNKTRGKSGDKRATSLSLGWLDRTS
eukprot:4925662-Pleurochrysis_carterae.AAC.5